MWPALTALLLAAAPPPHPVERQLQEISQCMQCCSPGGSCEYAYHQSKGFCCGTMQATAYCCPWPTSEAMCVRCNMGYKCAKAGSARSQSDLQRICADMGGAPSSSRPSYSPSRNSGYRSSPQQDMFGSLVGLLMLGLIVFAIYRCCVAAQQQQEQQMVQMGQTGGPPPAYGQPGYGQPGYGQGYPVQQSTGYGGGSVAAAGGAGLLGGVMVGSMLGGGGGYGGGGYGGGGSGGYDGGDGGGGGDAGFSADN